MKEIKTANYKKIARHSSSGHSAKGILNLFDDSSVEVIINFTYREGSPDAFYTRTGDPGEPGAGAEWEVISATDGNGRPLSTKEIDMYSDQLDDIIIEWSHNSNSFDDNSDDKYDAWKDQQLGGF